MRCKQPFSTAIFALFAATFSCASLAEEATHCAVIAQSPTTKNIPVASILEYVESWAYTQSGAPGMVVGVASQQENILIGCGETTLGNKQKPSIDTIWQVGSVSKVMTGTILTRMVSEGKAKLTDPVASYLPANFKIPSDGNQKITLLELATHTSGLPGSVSIRVSKEDAMDNPYDAAVAETWFKTAKLAHKPGTHFLYSNLGYALLGNALAAHEKMPYEALLKKYLTQPLGMTDTTTVLTPDQAQRKATSYWINGDAITDWQFVYERPAGGVYSTAADMLTFLKYHLNNEGSNAINHATYVYSGQTDNPISSGLWNLAFTEDGMSVGWDVNYSKQGLPTLLHKSGWVSGFTTWISFAPGKSIGMFAITNKPSMVMLDQTMKQITRMLVNNVEPSKHS